MSKSNKNAQTDCGSVTIMPDSDAKTLCITFSGLITLGEYEECFFKPLDKMVSSGVKFGLLINYGPDYKGWTTEAADLSFQSIINHGSQARKLAYVNPPEAKIFQTKMAKPLLGGEIRYFTAEELKEALKWVKS